MKKTLLFISLSYTLLFSTENAVIFGLKDGGTLSLREAPIKGNKIGQLKNGDKLIILESKGKWHKVKLLTSSKSGWAHGDWIKIFSITERATPTPTTVSNRDFKHKPTYIVDKKNIQHTQGSRPSKMVDTP